MDISERRIDGETVYSGVIVNVTMDRAELCDGRIVRREVVHHPGGVAVLPIDGEGYCCCVRQYRYPFQKLLLEVPAGKLEYGEEPRGCAERELSEETGLAAEKLVYLGPTLSSPGISTEVLHIYLALGLSQGASHPDEGEFVSVEKYHIDELVRMVMSGEIEDGKTVIAVLKAKHYLKTLK